MIMKKGKKAGFVFLLMSAVLIMNLFSVSAITGSIGNAKMVLYPEVNGWTNTVIEKTIAVVNVNDIPINVTLVVDEDSKDFLELFDTGFILQPNEEIKAKFEVKVKKEGTYNGKINVFFKPADPESKEPGVVLSSSIIVIAKKDQGYEEDSETEITGNVIDEIKYSKLSTGTKLFIGSGVLLIILLIMLIIEGKKRKPTKSDSKKHEK